MKMKKIENIQKMNISLVLCLNSTKRKEDGGLLDITLAIKADSN